MISHSPGVGEATGAFVATSGVSAWAQEALVPMKHWELAEFSVQY